MKRMLAFNSLSVFQQRFFSGFFQTQAFQSDPGRRKQIFDLSPLSRRKKGLQEREGFQDSDYEQV
jgi:hypothetical protein